MLGAVNDCTANGVGSESCGRGTGIPTHMPTKPSACTWAIPESAFEKCLLTDSIDGSNGLRQEQNKSTTGGRIAAQNAPANQEGRAVIGERNFEMSRGQNLVRGPKLLRSLDELNLF